jgi:hypothetical protein
VPSRLLSAVGCGDQNVGHVSPNRLRIDCERARRGENKDQREETESRGERQLYRSLHASLFHRIGISRDFRADVSERATCHEPKPCHTEQHANSGDAEAPMPANLLAEQPGQKLSPHRTSVDADVKDGKAGITTCAAFRIQIADHCGDVWFE